MLEHFNVCSEMSPLSVGMSNTYNIAIKEEANIARMSMKLLDERECEK